MAPTFLEQLLLMKYQGFLHVKPKAKLPTPKGRFHLPSGKIRAYGMDDWWLDHLYPGQFKEEVDINQVLTSRQLFKTTTTPADIGNYDVNQIYSSIVESLNKFLTNDDEQEAFKNNTTRYWEDMVIVLKPGHQVFKSDRLYHRWALSVSNSFEWYWYWYTYTGLTHSTGTSPPDTWW